MNYNNTKTITTQEPELKPIPATLKELVFELENTHKAMSNLDDRLTPIMTPIPQAPPTPQGTLGESSSPISKVLRELLDKTTSLRMHIQSITSAIDI